MKQESYERAQAIKRTISLIYYDLQAWIGGVTSYQTLRYEYKANDYRAENEFRCPIPKALFAGFRDQVVDYLVKERTALEKEFDSL